MGADHAAGSAISGVAGALGDHIAQPGSKAQRATVPINVIRRAGLGGFRQCGLVDFGGCIVVVTVGLAFKFPLCTVKCALHVLPVKTCKVMRVPTGRRSASNICYIFDSCLRNGRAGFRHYLLELL
jgi:hypothetical protein